MLVRRKEKLYCDVLVIGGGGAGLRAAVAAKLHNVDVLLVSKTKVGPNSNNLQGRDCCNRLGNTG